MNTYSNSDLRRIPSLTRVGPHRALALTRNDADVDFLGLRLNNMHCSDQEQDTEDVSPAPRRSFGVRAHCSDVLRDDSDSCSRACLRAEFPAISLFINCMVKFHEDVPEHIRGLFQALGIQYSWILTRGASAAPLSYITADLVIEDVKEAVWMVLHEHAHDLLENFWSTSTPSPFMMS